MKIQQIRNATLKLAFGGKTFLVDPWLVGKGEMGAFVDTPYKIGKDVDPAMAYEKMPLCDLPMPREDVLDGVDAYILTHLHPDHFDIDVKTGSLGFTLDKSVPIYVQSEDEAKLMKASGFASVGVLQSGGADILGVTVKKTPAIHGTEKPCGPASGLMLSADGEKKLYIVGDSVWFDGIRDALIAEKPDVVVVNACCASLEDYGHLIMDDAAIAKIRETLPSATVIASHMDNVAHATLTRKTLRENLARRGLADIVPIPEDGESLQF